MTVALSGEHSCSCGGGPGEGGVDHRCPSGECKCADCGVTCAGECSGESCESTVKHVAIAIDGPAGAGKTTTAKEVARRLGYIYVDTGALYRAFAVHKLWLSKEVAAKEPGSGPVTNQTALNTFNLEFIHENGEQVMMLWGENINPYLRTEEVSMEASNVATDPDVRAALLELQRRQALAYDVVMEGRDIGTVILPDAQVKIFLTASLNERANRRFKALIAAGEAAAYCTVMEQLRARDWQDSTRTTAPLKPACDAVQLDNTDLSFEDTVEKVLSIVQAKLG